jgi:uncharacterized protein YndB with AHSA1/START domain
MTVLYIILGIIGSLILLLVIFGFLSPRFAQFERSIEINASEQKVFEQMNSLKNFVHHWSPWTAKDPNSKMIFSGPETGRGSRYEWDGDRKKVGKGTMEIILSENNSKVKTQISFDGRGEAVASWTLVKLSDSKVKITWDFYSDNKYNPFARIFGRLMEKFMGADYEEGLQKLKAYCEK